MSSLRLTAVALTVVLALTVTQAAEGQAPDALVGKRVRVLGLTGTVLGATPDTLEFLQDTQGSPIRIARSRVDKIEVSTGRHRQVLKGSLIGLGVGALATAWFLHGFCGADSPCQEDEFLVAATVFGLPPVAVGAWIGALVRVERWRSVPLPGGGNSLSLGVQIPL